MSVCLQREFSLVPIQGSYSWFLCNHPSFSSLPQEDDTCPDPSSLVIHTRNQELELNVANITNEGQTRPLVQETTITVPPTSITANQMMMMCMA